MCDPTPTQPGTKAAKQQQQQQQHWAHPQKDKQLRYHSRQGQSRQNGKASLAAVTAAAPQALKMKKTHSQHIWTIPPNPQNAESWKSDEKSQMLDGLKS